MAVLITCALSVQAYQVKKGLPAIEEVILGDCADVPEVMIRSGQIIKLPSPAGASYQHEMLGLCLDQNIGIIYALRADEAIALTESLQLFLEYGITIRTNL